MNFSSVMRAVWSVHLLLGWRAQLWSSSLCSFFSATS